MKLSKTKIELIKYLMVGGTNAAMTFLIFSAALFYFRLNYAIALVISWACGVAFTYTINFLWVFKTHHKLQLEGHFVKYCTIYISSLAFNLLALHCLVILTGHSPFLLQCALMPVIVLGNYLGSKYWSLKPQAKQPS